MLDAALDLARLGYRVFPCWPDRKEPMIKGGCLKASSDKDVVERWFTHWADANLAIATGSGLPVIDVDRKRDVDGLQTLSKLEQEHGALPLTQTVRTPTGGEHRYFWTATELLLRNSASRLGLGIDVRAEGGYVLCPPSIVDGRPYVWLRRGPIAELPGTWLEAMARRPLRTQSAAAQPRAVRGDRIERWCLRALQDEAHAVAEAPRGTRNDRLWRAAAALGGLVHLGVISTGDVERALEWACLQWGERDARKDRDTVARGLEFGCARPRGVQMGAA